MRRLNRLGPSVVLLLLAASPLAGQDTTSAPPAGAPVVFRRDTLFALHGQIGAFTAVERAAAVSDRLRRVAALLGAGRDSIVVVEGVAHTELLVGDLVLMTVLDADAAPLGRPRPEVAAEHARTIETALQQAARRTTFRTILLGALFTLLATAVLLGLLRLMGSYVPRVVSQLIAWRETRIPALRIQKLELVSAARITDFLIGVVRFLRVALTVVLLYFYVPLVLSFFPWTEPIAGRILGYVISPLRSAGEGFVRYLPNVFFIAVIVLIVIYVLKFIRLIFIAIERGAVIVPGFHREWGKPTYKIVRFLVLAFVVVVLFPYLPGAESDAFKGVSIFLGALFTLGSSSAIANVVAGTLLTYTRSFHVGDRITIGETTGDVLERSLLVTRVRTIKNVDITIPNAQVLSSHITNYTTTAETGGVILHTTVTIGYDAPWRRVHELLIAAASATENILAEPAPFVLQTSLDDFYVSYQINAYTDKPASMAGTYSDLHQNIQDQFNAAGVEIMSPHYRSLRDGNQVTIPADQLPADYRTPSFRVSSGS